MRRTNFIALDVHSTFCEGGYMDDAGREKATWHELTAIPALVKVIESVPRPRKLVIEEGPLADWLYRNLSPRVDEMMVCDPHRNALIARDGDEAIKYEGSRMPEVAIPKTESRNEKPSPRFTAVVMGFT